MTSCPDCTSKDITILQQSARIAALEEQNASLEADCRDYTTAINDVCVSNQELREQLRALGGTDG